MRGKVRVSGVWGGLKGKNTKGRVEEKFSGAVNLLGRGEGDGGNLSIRDLEKGRSFKEEEKNVEHGGGLGKSREG